MVGSTSKERLFAAAIDILVASLLVMGTGRIVADSQLLLWTLPVGAFLGYYLVFEAVSAVTPGKLLFGLRVVSLDGARLSLRKAAIRTFFRLLEVNPLILGGIPAGLAIASSERNQRLGDRVAGTVVIKSAPTAEAATSTAAPAESTEGRSATKPLAIAYGVLIVIATVLAMTVGQTKTSRSDLVTEAESLFEQGNHSAAVESLTKALDLPGSVPDSQVRFLLATAYMKLGSVSDAEATLESAIASDPTAARPLALLGGIRKEQGRYPEARQLFQQAVEAQPSYYNAHTGLGSMSLLEGDFASAVGHLETAADLEPNSRHTWPALAMAYAYNGQFEKAWEVAEITRGFDYIEQSELEELIRDLQGVNEEQAQDP
ncbi:MAG: tetratricopeptide repeat protein [Acidobacteriota bacterium]